MAVPRLSVAGCAQSPAVFKLHLVALSELILLFFLPSQRRRSCIWHQSKRRINPTSQIRRYFSFGASGFVLSVLVQSSGHLGLVCPKHLSTGTFWPSVTPQGSKLGLLLCDPWILHLLFSSLPCCQSQGCVNGQCGVFGRHQTITYRGLVATMQAEAPSHCSLLVGH